MLWLVMLTMFAQIPASIQTVTAFVADAYITISLCVILWGRKTGFEK